MWLHHDWFYFSVWLGKRMAWVLWANHWAKKAKPIEFRFAFNTRWKIVLVVVYSFYKTVFLFCRVLIEIISILQLFINCYYLGLGERILREEKEMRDMKSRLLAIEAELQTLYRETGNESEVSNCYWKIWFGRLLLAQSTPLEI